MKMPGQDAIAAKGWFKAHRFLIARRASQAGAIGRASIAGQHGSRPRGTGPSSPRPPSSVGRTVSTLRLGLSYHIGLALSMRIQTTTPCSRRRAIAAAG